METVTPRLSSAAANWIVGFTPPKVNASFALYQREQITRYTTNGHATVLNAETFSAFPLRIPGMVPPFIRRDAMKNPLTMAR